MQFLKDLPQITQLSIALVLVLLPVLAVMVLRRRRKTAATPADGATRKERSRRPRAPKAEEGKRRRRRHAAAGQTGELAAAQPGDEADDAAHSPDDDAPDDIVIESPEEIIPVALDMSVGHDSTPALEDPYLVATPTLVSGDADASVAEPGWPSPGELASGFDPDAFDPLPPQAAHAETDLTADAPVEDTQPTTTIEIPAEDLGETWLDEDLTVAAPIIVTQTPQDVDDALVVAETPSSVDWDEDDEFDPATGWIDVEEPSAVAEETDDEPWDDDSEDDQPAAADLEPEAVDEDDEDAQAPFADVSSEPSDDPAGQHSMMVQWPAPQFDATLDDPQPSDAGPIASDEWEDDEDLTAADDDWDEEWDESSFETAVEAVDLAVPFPVPGTLPEHSRPAEGTVPFPALDLLSQDEADMTSPAPSAETPVPGPVMEPSADPTTPLESTQMPTITGLVGTNAASAPVVIDLANLVAHGERIALVIEQDANGQGVRLSFEASPAPTSVAQTPQESFSDAEHDSASIEGEPAEAEAPPVEEAPMDVPFLTGGPCLPPGAWPPVDEHDVPAEDRYVPAPTILEAPAIDTFVEADNADDDHSLDGAAVPSAVGDDDPSRILSDIRARLAALDRRHLSG